MKYVVYTHTDYIDIAAVYSDYLKYEHNVLLINKNNLILDEIYNKFQEIVYYDDRLPYAGRLFEGIKQIDSEYIFLVHDMDIPLSIDIPILDNLARFAKENYIDRLDLQHENEPITKDSIIIETEKFQEIDHTDIGNHKFCLVKSYLYNVNPSIWRKEALSDVLFNFVNESYRSIENIKVDKYCGKYSMYKLYTDDVINTGYYNVTNVFKFLHITHNGGLMPDNYENINKDVRKEYLNILKKYKFNRTVKPNMW